MDGTANAGLDGKRFTRVLFAENVCIGDRAEESGSVPRAMGKAKKETEEGRITELLL